MSRRHDPRRVRLHDCYTANELAQRFGIHIRSIRKWIACGLQPIDRHVPHLFKGATVVAFIRARNKPRVRLEPGEFFCTPCRSARLPVERKVWVEQRSDTTGDLRGQCETCERQVYRRVRLQDLGEVLGPCRLTNEDGTAPISSTRQPLEAPANEEFAAS